MGGRGRPNGGDEIEPNAFVLSFRYPRRTHNIFPPRKAKKLHIVIDRTHGPLRLRNTRSTSVYHVLERQTLEAPGANTPEQRTLNEQPIIRNIHNRTEQSTSQTSRRWRLNPHVTSCRIDSIVLMTSRKNILHRETEHDTNTNAFGTVYSP